MTFQVTFTVQREGGARTITTNIPGCQTPDEATRKVRGYYDDVLRIKKVVVKPD